MNLKLMDSTDNIIICDASAFPESFRHTFYSDYVGVIICHKGSFHLCTDGVERDVMEGETVVLSRGIMLKMQETADCFRFTLLFYHTEQISSMLGNSVLTMRLYSTIYPSSCHVLKTASMDSLYDYAQMLYRLEQNGMNDTYSQNEYKLLLMSLTYRLCSIFSTSFKAVGKELDRKLEIFESLIKLIDENFTRERSVAFYADRLCLTPKYLTVLVKSLCGKTVQQLLFKAIIRRSIFLMKNTNKTIQQIAYELSFPNASSFGTFFKKHTGLSPKNYRMGSPLGN